MVSYGGIMEVSIAGGNGKDQIQGAEIPEKINEAQAKLEKAIKEAQQGRPPFPPLAWPPRSTT